MFGLKSKYEREQERQGKYNTWYVYSYAGQRTVAFKTYDSLKTKKQLVGYAKRYMKKHNIVSDYLLEIVCCYKKV